MRRGSKNSNWRGGTSGKGVCATCGAPTWRASVKRCKRCYTTSLVGEKNPSWDHITSTDPQQGRAAATRRKKVGGPCERCKRRPSTLVHHIDENPLNNDPNNLLAVCKSCHSIVHNQIKRTGRHPLVRRAR